jgi:hypothetical protein
VSEETVTINLLEFNVLQEDENGTGSKEIQNFQLSIDKVSLKMAPLSLKRRTYEKINERVKCSK